MSHISLLYHIIFRTKYSTNAIMDEHASKLYEYMVGIARNRKSFVYIIGGMPNHIHMLISISPEIAISEFMQVLKSETSKWIKQTGLFPDFIGWGSGYAAFSYGINMKNTVYRYIQNQKEHHCRKSFQEEYEKIMRDNGLDPTTDLFLKD